MDFELTEEQRLAIDSWRGFLERDIRPIINEYLDTLIPKEVTHQLLRMRYKHRTHLHRTLPSFP